MTEAIGADRPQDDAADLKAKRAPAKKAGKR